MASKKEFPLISVIIPLYNHEKYIKKTLDSILNDSYPNKEIVIINDGSIDNSDRKVKRWINKHKGDIKVVYKYRKNKGLTKTLNELVDMARGEYLVLVASDDYLLNDGIMKRYFYLKNQPEKMAVFGDCIVVDEDDNIIYSSGLFELHNANKNNLFTDEGLKKEIILNWSVPGPVLMVKKEIFSIIGKYNERLLVEDWDFYLRMVSKNLIGYIDNKVSAYRLHSKSLGRSLLTSKLIYKHFFLTAFFNLRNFDLKYKLLLLRKLGSYTKLIVKSALR